MRSITRRKNLILAFVMGIICLVAGIFFYEKKEPTVTASAETTITTVEGFRAKSVQIARLDGILRLKFNLNITQEMSNNLSTPTQEDKGWFGSVDYKPNRYYIKATKIKDGATVYEQFFHIDPEHSDFSSGLLVVDGLTASVYFHMGMEWSTEFTYVFEYGYRAFGTNPEDFENHGNFYFHIVGEATNRPTFSVNGTARNVLTNNNDLTDEERKYLNMFAGYTTSSETFTVNLQYKEVVEYGKIETATEQYSVNSLFVGSGSLVYDEVSKLKGIQGISSFNAIYKHPQDGNAEEIILQADGYTYVYDEANNVGTLTIDYRPFQYKSFAVRVQDNDLENNENLYYYVRATETQENSETGEITITFDFGLIQQKLLRDFEWNCLFEWNNIYITNNSTLDVVLTNNKITVTFHYTQEDELKDINIYILAEIIPDYECNVTLHYSALTFNNEFDLASPIEAIVKTKESLQTTMMYSNYISMSNHYSYFQQSDLFKVVKDALAVPELGDQIYLWPYGVRGLANDDGSFELNVRYKGFTLIQIVEHSSRQVFFRAADKNSLEYDIEDLKIAPPAGLRIKTLEDPKYQSQPVKVEFNESEFTKLKVTLTGNTREIKIIDLRMLYSDTWNLNVEYMETYKNTPFAEKKTYSTAISVKDYNPEKLTLTDVKKIMCRTDDMKICGITRPFDDVDVELTSTSTYTVTLKYGQCSLRKIDYEGTISEVRVPLTSYVDWCETFGDDLTIMMLNTTEKTYFEDETDVARENLYGFFSVAIFEEQVSDFNYLFRNSTGDGNVVKFEEREAVGSTVYQFFDNLRTKGVVKSSIGHVGMAFCEILNDDNKILHSYFFYMDATEGYMSNGGADDKDDTDTALGNKVEDVGDGLKGSWNRFWDGYGQLFRIMFAVSGLAIVAVGVVIVVQKVKTKPKTSSGSKPAKKTKAKKSPKKSKKKS